MTDAMPDTNHAPYGLIVLSAPSGAGKSTLCVRMLRQLQDRLHLSISTTTRLPRGQEKSGEHYWFVSREEFQSKISQDRFAEWALVHENYYGTSKDTLEKSWSQNRHVLLDIDVQGAASLARAYPNRIFRIFIAPPSLQALEARLRGRGTDSNEAISKRMLNAAAEMARASEFDVTLVNDDLEEAYRTLVALVVKKMDSWETQANPRPIVE